MHPLAALILTEADALAALENAPGRRTAARRVEIAERSRYLSGLIDAARLTLGTTDSAPLADLL